MTLLDQDTQVARLQATIDGLHAELRIARGHAHELRTTQVDRQELTDLRAIVLMLASEERGGTIRLSGADVRIVRRAALMIERNQLTHIAAAAREVAG